MMALVSLDLSHESKGDHPRMFVLAVCRELCIPQRAMESTSWKLVYGSKDTVDEADERYHAQSLWAAREDQIPDLAVELMDTQAATKAKGGV
jgi:hypothetical protein